MSFQDRSFRLKWAQSKQKRNTLDTWTEKSQILWVRSRQLSFVFDAVKFEN